MAALDFSQFHELAEQSRGEISLKKICVQEGVSYRSYMTWRSRNGIAPRKKRKAAPEGMVEIEAVGTAVYSPKATSVYIEFENGLKFDRSEMDVVSLVEFLTKIRCTLCLG